MQELQRFREEWLVVERLYCVQGKDRKDLEKYERDSPNWITTVLVYIL